MTTSGHECPIVRLPVERPMAPCGDLSYATTRSPLILAGCALRSPIIRSLGDFLLQLFQESPLVEPRPVDSLFRSSPSSAV